ncbi:uncharacterized protein E0L32_007477 [Thyridium curvatum]|uniref:Uncharacterized protein n=1 Tax=Thyridium curvatum TaxID=1093900 RepID=A0A507B554_9PEZI|nr:uncharacterized protein E0L32_007477 [Thyridium curvatum]TPX11740.1 hypothetical protein E0L32_007477 [Thyridium curvatum]
MATVAKTIIATGASSGLGFEAMKQLLQTPQSYRIIIGARNTERTESAYNTIAYNHQNSSVVILPLELSDLKQVQIFAHRAVEVLDQGKVDYLLLNAAIHGTADGPGSHGSQWCEPYIVNHLSQHYLLHLLQDHLVKSQSRIVVVSSGAIHLVPDDLTTLSTTLKAGADTNMQQIYCTTKFIQLLSAHWWRRQLSGSCEVVAVSPGLVPDTGLMAKHKHQLPDFSKVPDAISVPKGKLCVLLPVSIRN